MSPILRTLVAALAIAALVGGALGGCACVMPSAATAAHDCCDRDAGPVLSVSHGCCGGGTATAAPVLVVAALHAAPAPAADAVPLPVAAAAPTLAAASAALSSAPPLILRI